MVRWCHALSIVRESRISSTVMPTAFPKERGFGNAAKPSAIDWLSVLLLRQRGADFVEVTGAAEHLVLAGDHLRVLIHERYADIA